MSTTHEQVDNVMLHSELHAEADPDAIIRDGRRLDHAEGTSKPLRPAPEPQPRGAKVRDHAQAGAEYIVSADSSCLMHQQGCAERIGVPMKFIHIAEILNGASA